MKLSEQTIKAINKDVLARYPEEASGVIINGEYVPVKNSSPTPLTDFSISARSQINVEKRGRIEAIIHSHPYDVNTKIKFDPRWASHSDMVSFINGNVPWGIVATDGEGVSEMTWLDDAEIAPYEGRWWANGSADCFTLLRDYYAKEYQINLKNYPRQLDWYLTGQNYVQELYEDAGFVEIGAHQVKPGDLIIMKWGSRVDNHLAIYLDHSTILHHCYGRYSGKDKLQDYMKHITKWARHKERKV